MKNLFSRLFLSKGVDYFSDDRPLQEALNYFGFVSGDNMPALGRYVSEELVETLDFIDHHARPELHMWDVLGERIDYVRLSPDHARALSRLQELGVVRSIAGPDIPLMQHFISGYVISDSGIFCTITLTAQTAYALEKYGDDLQKSRFLENFYRKEDPWYGATFYSEVQGGSDIGANRTVAHSHGSGYTLDGADKYFASDAGIADLAVTTARFENSPEGAKGISLFLVPAYREDGSPNYIIRRLKDKLGTVSVPTGEVEFSSSEAYLIGKPENGIYMAMEVLVISRIDDAIAAVGIARKALWEAYLYSRERKAFGKRLIDHSLMFRDFIQNEVDLEASLALALLSAKQFDSVTSVMPPYNGEYQLARLLGNMAKSVAADTSAEITRYAMEMLGGIGFFEEFPMAKFHRDSIVTSIWEGTSNIQALECLEVLSRKNGMDIFGRFLDGMIHGIEDTEFANRLRKATDAGMRQVEELMKSGDPEFYAKDILGILAKLAASAQMELIGQKSKGGNSPFALSSRLYFRKVIEKTGIDHTMAAQAADTISWMSRGK